MKTINCPKCKESHYQQGVTQGTANYYPPIIKDGVNINPDRNEKSTELLCIPCGHTWVHKTN